MQEKHVDYNTFKLHMIKTKKFKTISFKLFFRNNIKKEDITIRNVLLDYLVYSCNKYKTKKEMSIKKQDLYGVDLTTSSTRYGNNVVTEFSFTILDPKYTEKDMLDRSLSFFNNILFDPNHNGNRFDEEILKLIINQNRTDLQNIKNNPSYYSNIRLSEEMKKDPSSYRMVGYIEDLDDINVDNLYKYYKDFISNAYVDLFVIGDFKFKEMESLIKKYFIFNVKGPKLKELNLSFKASKKDVVEKKEETSNNQTRISIGCLIDNLTSKEREFVAIIYSIILGNSPEAKLFMNVREKKSLAYSVSSSFKRTDGILIISSGISYENYDKAILAIKEELKNMKSNITNEELNAAKKLYISVLKETYEYPFSILDYMYQMEYLNALRIEESIDIIKNITKEEIYELAKKVYIDTIFVLKEGV